jgi:hypothetical protein
MEEAKQAENLLYSSIMNGQLKKKKFKKKSPEINECKF